MPNAQAYDAFISYRRDGGAYIARALNEGIERANSALRVFIDLDELRGGNFNEALLRVIEQTPNFLIVLSKDALLRCQNEGDWVRRELAHAISLGKNIIPVIEDGVPYPEKSLLPADIADVALYNGVTYSPQHHADAIKKIIGFFTSEVKESSEQRVARVETYFQRSMVEIPRGSFVMGSDNGKADERPTRVVNVNGFWMMKYPASQSEYERVMNVNPGNFQNPHKPVQNVSWFDAITFCNRRSERDGLSPVYEVDEASGSVHIHWDRLGYRLPSEAEWEYACRAGSTTEFHWGDDKSLWDIYAWHDRNSDDMVHVSGTRRPNAWGLYDMTGNVFEWCNDWYEPDYYSFGECDNPRGPDRDFGEYRVMRGGAWAYDPRRLRSAARLKRDPALTDDVSGFRCVIARHPLRT